MTRSPTVTLALVLICLGTGWAVGAAADGQGTPRPVSPRGPLGQGELSTVQLFEEASPSVVFISRIELWRAGLWTPEVTEVHAGTGTGFVWDTAGHVVTNYHVTEGARRLLVTMHDQTTYEAEVVGRYADKDLAVLRIDAPARDLRPLPIGTSRDLRVGQDVFAIGNPFGLDQSLSTGVVSALSREMRSPSGRRIRDVIQTDAAINPGNSGGPLLDSAGRLVGVNTMIVSSTGSFAGIGFAVPVDVVNRVVPQIVATGKYLRPGLGIAIAPSSLTRRFAERGVMVGSVEEGSAAARAGLVAYHRRGNGAEAPGDVILAVDGVRTVEAEDLIDRLETYEVGDRVLLEVLREDEPVELAVTLQALPTTR